MDTFTLELSEAIIVTAIRLPREPVTGKWRKALTSWIFPHLPWLMIHKPLIVRRLISNQIRQELRWEPPDCWSIEIRGPFTLTEYRILAHECTPENISAIGLDHLKWQRKAFACAFAARNFRDGFARITVNVPEKLSARAFPRTPWNALIEDVDEGWWWLEFTDVATGETVVYVADPEVCTPDLLIDHGENHNWFSTRTWDQGISTKRPLSEVEVKRHRKSIKKRKSPPENDRKPTRGDKALPYVPFDKLDPRAHKSIPNPVGQVPYAETVTEADR